MSRHGAARTRRAARRVRTRQLAARERRGAGVAAGVRRIRSRTARRRIYAGRWRRRRRRSRFRFAGLFETTAAAAAAATRFIRTSLGKRHL